MRHFLDGGGARLCEHGEVPRTSAATETIRFEMLGPLRAFRGPTEIDVGSAQQRAVLAVLLSRPCQPVHRNDLIRCLWTDPPHSAANVVQTYVGRLRRALEPWRRQRRPDEMLASTRYGYQLDVGSDQIDVGRYVSASQHARDLRERGELAAALAAIGDALGLHTGQPLDGLPGPWARAERARLVEEHLVGLEFRLELELGLGLYEDLVAQISRLIAEHPLRERLRALLMLALSGMGRQAEALAAFQDARRTLVDQVGIEPGPELQDLHARILNGDEVAPVRTLALSANPTAPVPVPSQLPAAVADFTGRDSHVRRLLDALDADGAAPTVAIVGSGGVGKTALALHVAHRLRERFPDGQLFVDLLAERERPRPPVQVLGSFLQDLGVEPAAVPAELDRRVALFRSLVAGRRILFVYDDARDAAQLLPLLPGTSSCRVLITSRRQLSDLSAVESVDLGTMDDADALVLVRRIVGADRVDAEPEAVSDLLRSCCGLPLALRVASARLAARPNWTVSWLAGRLLDEYRRLDELRTGDLAVRASLQISYDWLSRHDEDGGGENLTQRAFRLLGSVNLVHVTVPPASALLGVSEQDAERALESLVDAYLIESPAPGRYHMHDLLRIFARQLCNEHDPDEAVAEAHGRVLDYYLEHGRCADRHLWPGGRIPGDDAEAAEYAPSFPDAGAALEWLDSERLNLTALVHQTCANPLVPPVNAALLVSRLRRYFELRGYWPDWEGTARAALEAGLRESDLLSEALMRSELGFLAVRRERLGEASRHYDRSLQLFGETGDLFGKGRALNGLACIARLQRRFAEAVSLFDEVMAIGREIGDVIGQTTTLNNLGFCYVDMGAYADAIACARDCIERRARLGAGQISYVSLNTLGRAHHGLGQLTEAVDNLERSVRQARERKDRYWLGNALTHLSAAYADAGRLGDATECCEQAVSISRDLGHEQGAALALRQMAYILRATGHRERAAVCWQDALVLLDSVDGWQAAEMRAETERFRESLERGDGPAGPAG